MEEKRPGEFYPVYEDDRGSYILNSKDLCLIEHIPELVQAGVASLKIEGRMKSSYYVATVVKSYREALDSYLKNPEGYRFNPDWLEEMSKASHREYTTGFLKGKPHNSQVYSSGSYIRDYDFVGLVIEYNKETGIAKVEQRNRMKAGETVEVVPPKGPFFPHQIYDMKNEDYEDIDVAPHPQMTVYMPMEREVEPFSMLRRKA
jgi:putative protease